MIWRTEYVYIGTLRTEGSIDLGHGRPTYLPITQQAGICMHEASNGRLRMAFSPIRVGRRGNEGKLSDAGGWLA